MLKLFASITGLIGVAVMIHAAAMLGGSGDAWTGPDWLYRHY